MTLDRVRENDVALEVAVADHGRDSAMPSQRGGFFSMASDAPAALRNPLEEVAGNSACSATRWLEQLGMSAREAVLDDTHGPFAAKTRPVITSSSGRAPRPNRGPISRTRRPGVAAVEDLSSSGSNSNTASPPNVTMPSQI